MPDYYEPGSTETNATLLVVTPESTGGSFAPGDAPAEIEDAQATMTDLASDDDSMAALVYGDGVVSTEMTDSMIDSVLLVGPLAIAFVLLVLVVVYWDLLDTLLGLLGIALVFLWTFGTMGWFDIAFSQPFIVVLVLLIGLSIDYGLHVVMRYREARESNETSPSRAMAVALGSVGVALVYITTTTVIGFLSNLTSPLGVFRELGVVSAIGIVATVLVFGLLVPALKVELDELLERRGIDRVKPAVGTGGGGGQSPLGYGCNTRDEGSLRRHRRRAPRQRRGRLRGNGHRRQLRAVGFPRGGSRRLVERPPRSDRAGDVHGGDSDRHAGPGLCQAGHHSHDTRQGDVTDPATLDQLDAARTNASDMSATESLP